MGRIRSYTFFLCHYNNNDVIMNSCCSVITMTIYTLVKSYACYRSIEGTLVIQTQ